jgi:hypothetical protein
MNLFGRVPGRAVLTVAPASLDFGDARRTTNSATLTAVVTNTGESDVTGTVQVTKTGTTAARGQLILVSGCDGLALAAGASCNLVARVNPTDLGASPTVGFLVQSSDAAAVTAGETVSLPVRWNGTGAPAIGSSSDALTFAATAVLATSPPQTVTLTNPANGEPTGPLTFTIDDPNFAVHAVAGTTKCGDVRFSVNGLDPSATGNGGVCSVTVTFTPTALTPGNKRGNLTVTSTSGTTTTVTLAGTAKAALSLASANVASTAEDPLRTANGCDYTGGTTTCDYNGRSITAGTFNSETFTFQNAAGSPATSLLAVDLTGASFRIVTDTCTGTSLTPGGTTGDNCKVTVRFAPTTTGNKTGSLTVSGTPGNSVAIILTGTANP